MLPLRVGTRPIKRAASIIVDINTRKKVHALRPTSEMRANFQETKKGHTQTSHEPHVLAWVSKALPLLNFWNHMTGVCMNQIIRTMHMGVESEVFVWLLKSRLPRILETGRHKLSRQHSVDENVGRKWLKWLKRPNLNDLHVIAAALQHRISPWRLHSTGLLISHFLTNWKYHAKKLKECEGVLQFHRRKAAGKLGAWRSRGGAFKEQRKH